MAIARRWLGPALIALAVMVLWSWLGAPWLAEYRADLQFLRAYRLAFIQQQQQAQPKVAAEAK